jgi:RimJ/RimL family protein N-acetyltransferase
VSALPGEAARAALAHATGPMGRRRVVSLIRPGNVASIRVAAKLGMMPERTIELLGGPVQVHAYAHG